MTIYKLDGLEPEIHDQAWIATESTVIGSVKIGSQSSVWPGAVIRGDNDAIIVEERVNIQEGAVLHTDAGFVLHVASGVSIGHQAMLHGCSVDEGSLIGIQAVVLNGATIGKHCLVGAGALVTAGTAVPDRSLVLGSPAKVVRELSDEEVQRLAKTADGYVDRAARYKAKLAAIEL